MKRSKRPTSSSGGDDESSTQQRLQKVLAAAGLGSRRDCEAFILEGRVEVNRHTVTELGTKVNPLTDEIRVDGTSLQRPKKLYFALNKPPGVVSTNFDPAHRTRVIDLIPTEERLFPVGRLDRGSEGLILVTNDGELANRVTHPRYGLEKTYFVRVAGSPTNEELLKLRRGVHLAEGVARVVSIQVRKRYRQHTDLEIVLNEGKNREIRRILARVGHKVMLLRRLAVGPVRLGDLPLGATRRLTGQEVAALVEATSRKRTRTAAPRAKPATETFREATFTERPAGTRAPRAAAESTARVAAERTVRGERDSQVRTGGARPPKTFPAAAGAEPRRGAAAQVAPAARSGSARPPAKAPAAMSPSPQPPAAQSLAAAPPKLDLAMLLDPRSAPKVAMAVGPAKGAAARPEVGDVLDYDSGDQASVQGFTSPPTGQSRRRSVVPTTPPLEIDSEREPPLDAAAQARPSDARPARPDRQERPARARGKAPAGSSRGRPRPAGRPGQKPEGASRSGAPVREARSERGRAAPATRKGSGSSPRGAKSGGRRAAAGPAPRGKTGTGRAGFGKKGPGKKGRRS